MAFATTTTGHGLPTPTSATSNPADPYYFFQAHTQHQSPYNSASATPTAHSPTSPRTTSTSPTHTFCAYKHEQLRKPRAPLYIPAVLRPTEFHSKCGRKNMTSTAPKTTIGANTKQQQGQGAVKGPAGPLTPPSSAGTSFDSQDGSAMAAAAAGATGAASVGPDGKLLLGDDYFKACMNRIVTDEWNEDMMEDVTGAPTRDHWKPDSSSPKCDSTTCDVGFSFMTRRHHCRRCGHIFCSGHSQHQVPLDQHARFHPQGIQSRACENCYSDFKQWSQARSHRGSSSAGTASGTATPTGEIGADAVMNGGASAARMIARKKKVEQPKIAETPKEWQHWSTF